MHPWQETRVDLRGGRAAHKGRRGDDLAERAGRALSSAPTDLRWRATLVALALAPPSRPVAADELALKRTPDRALAPARFRRRSPRFPSPRAPLSRGGVGPRPLPRICPASSPQAPVRACPHESSGDNVTRPSSLQRIRSKRAFAYSTLAFAATLALVRRRGAARSRSTPATPTSRSAATTRSALNYGVRVESRDSKIGNSALADEGDYSFDKGDAVAKRIDLLSEFDLVYKKRYGLRVSGAGWYDGAYGDTSQSQSEPAAGRHPQLRRQPVQLARSSASTTAGAARSSTPSSSAASTSATCRCRPSSAATRSTGASRCCSAATCTASPTRRTRSTCRRASPRPAPKPRNCSGR